MDCSVIRQSAAGTVDKNDEYLDGILNNIHLHIDLVKPAVHRFQSGPHRLGKTRQHEGKENRGNDMFERLADHHEESEVHESERYLSVNDADHKGVMRSLRGDGGRDDMLTLDGYQLAQIR